MHSISGTVCLGPLGAPCVFHPQPQPAAVACLAQSLCAFQAQRALETWLYNLNPIEPDRWSPHAACCLLLLACCEPLTACCLLMVQGAPHPLTPGAGTKRCQPREAADQPMPRPRPPCLLLTHLSQSTSFRTLIEKTSILGQGNVLPDERHGYGWASAKAPGSCTALVELPQQCLSNRTTCPSALRPQVTVAQGS